MMTRLFLAFHHVRPLYIALAIAACVLTLLTVFSSADLAGGHAARRLSVGRSFALPTYFSRLYHLSTPQEPNIFHPIPAKMKAAERKFQQMINSQSRSFQQAVAEYERRYDRPPPQGFDDWYSFATANGAIIIDEYDQLEADLRPFWLLSGAEIRRRSLDVGLLPSVDLVRIQDGRTRTIDINTGFEDSEVGARARGFRLMLEKFKDKLPDMDFPINEKAEGRILVPWEQNQFANLTVAASKGIRSVLGGEFIPDWRGDGGSVWEAFRRTCEPTTQARRLFSSIRSQLSEDQVPFNWLAAAGVTAAGTSDDFVFPDEVDDRYSFCDHPWAHNGQGHFFSDWRTIGALYPMFSPAKAPGYSDILIPSHYYFSPTKRYTYGYDPAHRQVHEIDAMDVPWEQKTDHIFWRGATTGGGSTPPDFLSRYQRHRFLRMTSDRSASNKSVVFKPPSARDYIERQLPLRSLNEEIMDVAFVKAVGCTQYAGGCDGLRKDHRFDDPVPLGENWRHKYLIDIDGMGYSARFFALLMSQSAVLKATVYTEFYSDWIQPRLHYIPITSSYKEIYNLHAYFSGPSPAMSAAINVSHPAGRYDDRELRKIAAEGRKWKTSIGRKVDMEIYVYRMALEWARLVSDDRGARSYKG